MRRTDTPLEFLDNLHAHNLRVTEARLAVLRVLSDATSPLSHQDVVEKLANTNFDRATLFRNLVDMAQAGILKRIDLGDHVWRFEFKSDNDVAHPHFLCMDCGDVECLPEVDVTPQIKDFTRARNVGHIDEVLLKGHCQDCEESA